MINRAFWKLPNRIFLLHIHVQANKKYLLTRKFDEATSYTTRVFHYTEIIDCYLQSRIVSGFLFHRHLLNSSIERGFRQIDHQRVSIQIHSVLRCSNLKVSNSCLLSSEIRNLKINSSWFFIIPRNTVVLKALTW